MNNATSDLIDICKQVRLTLTQVSQQTKTPHLGSCLSGVELLVVLYWRFLNISPQTVDNIDRDIFQLSKGHAASLLYTVLANRDFFPTEQLFTHGKTGSLFEEHSGVNSPAGVEMVSGSLGHGLSLITGMALASKIQGLDQRFYTLMGDGELNEGTVWEAAMFAANHQLANVTAMIDFNKWQGTGRSEQIMHLDNLAEKWQAFGWHVQTVDGHNIEQISEAYQQAIQYKDKPSAIIANTVKGKGISFMEDDNNWHYRMPTELEVDTVKQELGLA